MLFFYQQKKRKEIKCLTDKTVIFLLEEAGTGKAGKGESADNGWIRWIESWVKALAVGSWTNTEHEQLFHLIKCWWPRFVFVCETPDKESLRSVSVSWRIPPLLKERPSARAANETSATSKRPSAELVCIRALASILHKAERFKAPR